MLGIEPNRVVHYKPLLDHAVDAFVRRKPEACIVVQRPRQEATLIPGRDYDYASLIASANPRSASLAFAEPIAFPARPALFSLYLRHYGQAEGRRPAGAHMVALKWTMHKHYGIAPGDVFWAVPTSAGWLASPIAYAPLLHGATTILYEGKPVGTPNAARCCA